MKMVTEQDIDEIVKTFPNPRIMLPGSAADEQIKTHLMKYFKLYKKPRVDEKEKKQ